ncbi:HlyD family secretion protein [Robiginitalea myxolifaciens]|uniref:HlyD family secretion protein n=1 Tax=Robiginitalea myxolifaciens TaxID=400055 RepID=A0A1I6HB07_9FLAO|nr:HlyD family efflux transporter periplasmic adaptor subunit [Robiginitalea myxolifaciens]SFR51457.1 HlyD family secretion protein [Robiginitalea myxolifaciens]
MDKRIKRSATTKKKWKYGIGALVLIALTSSMLFSSYKSTFEIDPAELLVAEVTTAEFTSAISLQGVITPKDFIVIDAKQSGSVKRIYKEAGDPLLAGDTILILENSNLELEVLQRESQLLEQLNGQRQTKILLNQNDLNQKEELAEINYQIDLQKPRYERNKKLYARGVISLQEYEEISKSYLYFLNRKELFKEAYNADSRARSIELGQIRLSEKRIEQNLEAVNQILNRLIVQAQQDGRLGDFEIQLGQTINEGDRIGEIYEMAQPIILAQVDELYINSIETGTQGTATINGSDYSINVQRIIPTITSGNFQIELSFVDAIPENLRKGQTSRVQLFLSEAQNSTVLPVGQFYNSTGGNWVYKINNGEAVKTQIQLGNKNADYHEVLNGLAAGDRVIISSYDRYKEFEKIKIDKQ